MPTGLLTIKLENLRFYGYHGLYPEERCQGGEYRVDLEVDYRTSDTTTQEKAQDTLLGSVTSISPIIDLSQTIDYVQLYTIVKEEMGKPRELLETITMCIVGNIAAAYSCERIVVEIKKFTVPISDFSGNTAIRYEWKA